MEHKIQLDLTLISSMPGLYTLVNELLEGFENQDATKICEIFTRELFPGQGGIGFSIQSSEAMELHRLMRSAFGEIMSAAGLSPIDSLFFNHGFGETLMVPGTFPIKHFSTESFQKIEEFLKGFMLKATGAPIAIGSQVDKLLSSQQIQ